ncbi:MAG: GHKL domain-containing protein [Eubacterium sp.]|nr:GHKL domain-containing protein [Eubacterium sp.]
MYIYPALLIGLTASILFAENWLYGKYPKLIQMVASLISATAVYFILFSFWENCAFFSALAAGQLACLIYSLVCRERKVFLAEICLYSGFDAVWLPICFCKQSIRIYVLFFALLLLCIALIPMGRSNKQDKSGEWNPFYTERNKSYYLLSCLPVVALFPAVLFLLFGERTIISALSFGAVLILIYALLLWLQREIAAKITSEELNKSLSQWQQESRDYMNIIRSQRHDFNLHLHAISGLVNSGEYEKCNEYVQKLVADANAVNDIMPVSDAVVGSMLYNMREEARRCGSDIIYHITYDMEDILCNGFECNKIIGNLLQNAIDALYTQEDKAYGIHLKIFKRRGNTVITTENRFTGDPDKIARVFEPGYSTKKNHDGIGLSMVLRTAERYGGRVYPEFEEDRIRFVVNIPNRVNLLKGDEAI